MFNLQLCKQVVVDYNQSFHFKIEQISCTVQEHDLMWSLFLVLGQYLLVKILTSSSYTDDGSIDFPKAVKIPSGNFVVLLMMGVEIS